MAFPNFGAPSPTKPNEGKVPQGGLGQLMQSLLGKGRPQGAPPQPPQGPQLPPQGTNPGFGMPGLPPGMPDPASGAPMIPGAPPMPGPGGPMQGVGISPEEMQAIIEQIKGELARNIAGQSGQQDQIYNTSAGLGKYRPMAMTPMGNPAYPRTFQQAPGAPPYVPPGTLPPTGQIGQSPFPPRPVPQLPPPPQRPRTIPVPPEVPPTNYGPYTR